MDEYIKLAKEAVETYARKGEVISPPEKLPSQMARRAGVFVSLHKKKPSPLPTQEPKKEKPLPHLSIFDGLETEELRGCIGTFLPTTENIATEIIKNAVHSASADPRFPPVTEDELSDLIYSVDILSEPKKLAAKRYTLDPKKYGLIVSTPDGRRGLLLPNIPGIETAEEQFKICCLKAGIFPEEKVTLEIFTVKRHAEK